VPGRSPLTLDAALQRAWRAFCAHAGAFTLAIVVGALVFAPWIGLVAALEHANEREPLDPLLRYSLECVFNLGAAVTLQALRLGMARMSLAALRGQAVSATDVLDVRDVLVPGLVTGVLVSTVTTLGSLACIIPGIIAWCATCYWDLFIVDKKLAPIAALQATFGTTRGHRGTLFVFGLLALILLALGAALVCVGLVVTLPLMTLVNAALYEQAWPAARLEA
jgi:uncharacterized membrane protein